MIVVISDRKLRFIWFVVSHFFMQSLLRRLLLLLLLLLLLDYDLLHLHRELQLHDEKPNKPQENKKIVSHT